MHTVELSSPRVRLDQPRPVDAPRVFDLCQDPLFERYLAVLPWPYQLTDATAFVSGFVPEAWAAGTGCTWALRAGAEAGLGPGLQQELLGVISLALPAPERTGARTGSIGFWLGAPYRGRGLIGEAQRLVLDWAFTTDLVDTVRWECVAGNLGSARAARVAGFRYTGQAPSGTAHRDGSHPLKWHALLHTEDAREAQPGWPAEVMSR